MYKPAPKFGGGFFVIAKAYFLLSPTALSPSP